MPTQLFFYAETALRQGDLSRAAEAVDLLDAAFGPLPTSRFLAAALAVRSGALEDWSRAISGLYSVHGITSPILKKMADKPLFDRLSARPSKVVSDGPLVSVILPVRNGEQVIDTALGGLQAQGWRNLEILVIDNGSEDATAARVAMRAAHDARIHLIDGAAEPGVYAARNLGLAHAHGSFITVHDADDWSHPDKIRLQIEASDQRAGNLSCLLRLSEDLCPGTLRLDVGPLHPNLSSLLLRRDAVQKAGFWDRVRVGADSEYIARLRHLLGDSAITVIHSKLPLAFGRITDGSLTQAVGTGLFGHAAVLREAYAKAARNWHQSGADLRLTQYPPERPFPAPSELVPLVQRPGHENL